MKEKEVVKDVQANLGQRTVVSKSNVSPAGTLICNVCKLRKFSAFEEFFTCKSLTWNCCKE